MTSLHPQTLEFLTAIAEHNSRSYFALVKPLYIQIWDQLSLWTQDLIDQYTKTDPDLQGLQAKDCLFRIYRDARRLGEGDLLYKQNRGIVISEHGKKSRLPSFYIHLQPGGSFVCAGLYRPDTSDLLNLRHFLADHGGLYTKLVASKGFTRHRGLIQGESLTGLPRGRDPQTLYPDLVRRKQFLITRHYSDTQVLSTGFAHQVVQDYRQARDFLTLLNQGCEYRTWKSNT